MPCGHSIILTDLVEFVSRALISGANGSPSAANRGVVFTDVWGAPLLPDRVSEGFDRRVQKSRRPRIRFHDLRHTHASHLLKAGVNIKIVPRRLGHASVSFTLDKYSHLMPDDDQQAALAVAALVDASVSTLP